MAERAIRAQATLMMLVAMACDAIQRRAFVSQRPMALFARHNSVPSDQGKSCNVVIKGRHAAPTGLIVTAFTAGTQLAFVTVVLAVTGYAGRCKLVAIEIAGVTRIAFDFRVRASQRIFRRLVMVEADRAPLVLIMTGFALCAISPGVDILNSVAIDARKANSLVPFANMACRALNVAMRSLKPELGLVMIERFDPLPCGLKMAVVAGFSEASFMWITRFVTIEAAPGCISKFYRLRVTAAALDRFVSIAEFEVRECVVECFAIKLNNVGGSPFVVGMAVSAVLFSRIRLPSVKLLAFLTIDGNVFVTRETQARLRFSREWFVAVATILLELRMSVDHRPRNDEPFE
jgi:hypothetical protein